MNLTKIKDTLEEHLIEYILIAILAILSSLVGIVWKEIIPLVLTKVLPEFSQKSLLAIASLFLLIILIEFIIIILLNQKPKLKDYEFIEETGFYKHKKTGAYYCHPCLVKRGLKARLRKWEKYWQCFCCERSYDDFSQWK